MSSGTITALTGIVVAVSALIANLFSYRKVQAETDKLKAETEKIRSEAAEISSNAANAEAIARLAYPASPQTLTLYDSRRNGFSQFDFKSSRWVDAEGELRLASSRDADDDMLVIIRNNTAGTFVAWLKSYGYKDKPDIIPVGDAAGKRRMFRVQCQVRAHEAEHTFLTTLKMEGAPQGQHLGQRRHRITVGAWVDIDDHFDVSFSANCQLRLEDRSVSSAPSRLEIRHLVVTEREPPRKLLPSTG